MLRIIGVKSLARDLISVGKGNTFNKVGDGDSKVDQAKSKNMIISEYLTKSKLLVKANLKAGFLTSRARLVFIKLKQVFIEVLIL